MNVLYVQFLVQLQLVLLYIIRRACIRYIFISICIFFSTFVLILFLRTKYEEENNHHIKYGHHFHPKDYDESYKDEEELRFGKIWEKYLTVDNNPESNEEMPVNKKAFLSGNMYDLRKGRMILDDYEPNKDILPLFLKIKRSPKGMKAIPGNDSTWQDVSTGFRVFSAFFDRRMPSNPFIRIIAAANKPTMPMWCRLWYNISDLDEWHFAHVKAVLKEGEEGKKNYYRSILVTCPMAQHSIPVFVSLMTRNEIWPYNILVVRNSEVYQEPRKIPYLKRKDDFHPTPSFGEITTGAPTLPIDALEHGSSDRIVLCVKLPYLADIKVMNLMEFLEMYMVVGVRHFFLYTPPHLEVETMCLLSNYTTDGFITLLPWVASYMDVDDFVFEAKDSADNDCVYRAMYTYTYAVLVEMNEFILPRKHYTLQQLLAYQVSHEKSALVSGFLFPKATFCMRWDNEDRFANLHSDILQDALVTFVKTRREKYLVENKECIIVPDKVLSVQRGSYSTLSSLNEKLNVSSKLAMLQQYTSDEDSCRARATSVDTTSYRFTYPMLERVWTRFSGITCPKLFNYAFYKRDADARFANLSKESV